MSAGTDAFLSAKHAHLYKRFWKNAPDDCIKKIIAYLSTKFDPSECIAVDVGCGSGQCTFTLAKHMFKVIGVDPSEVQVNEGKNDPRRNKNTEFRLGAAESLPIEDHSVHLVFAMHAAHWFDYEAFKKEVDRVLVPNGVLALSSTDRFSTVIVGFDDEYNKIFQELMDETKLFWSNESLHWDTFYKNAVMPYKTHTRDFSVTNEYEISVYDLVGAWKTISGVFKFIENNPIKGEMLINKIQDKLLKMTKSMKGPEETYLHVKDVLYLLLARKPPNASMSQDN